MDNGTFFKASHEQLLIMTGFWLLSFGKCVDGNMSA